MHIPRPEALEPGRNPVDTGAVVLGEKGTIMYGSHGAGGVRIIPETKMKAVQAARRSPSPASRNITRTGWRRSARAARPAPISPYGAPVTEIAMLGVIASKLPGTKLEWDGENMKFTNCPDANQYVNPPARKGWTV